MSKNGYPDGTIEDKLLTLTERVSLLEATRAFRNDARPVHVIRSKYQILEEWPDVREILWKFAEVCKTDDTWKLYPQVLIQLQEILAPSVAKELLGAYIKQFELA